MMWKYVRLFLFGIGLHVATSAYAQVIDGFEFGKKSAVAVRLATQLDYMMQACQGQKTSLYLNQVDFVLRRINCRSAQRVKENAARANQISVRQINRLAEEEVEQVLSQYGGCNSNNYQTLVQRVSSYFEEHMKYLANVAQMTERSGGRNLID